MLYIKYIHKDTITNNFNEDQNRYFAPSETPFKERSINHTKEYKHQKYKKCSELLKCIFSLKSQDIVATIKLKIMKIIKGKVSINYWKLCLTETFLKIESFDVWKLVE